MQGTEDSPSNDSPVFSRDELFAFLKAGRTRGFELIRRPDFPQGIALSDSARGTSVVYLRSEVMAWLLAQPRRTVGAEPTHLVESRKFRDGKPFVSKKHRARTA
jgi:predicted DNA-binding transcriptional regulator AlpA